jgi:uncharacterized membrane protein
MVSRPYCEHDPRRAPLPTNAWEPVLLRDDERTRRLGVASVTAPTVQQREPTTASTRKTAALIGLLFLTATVTFATADGLISGVLDGPDFLTGASEDANALATAALLALVQGGAIVGTAVFFFPLLKRESEPLALAYVGLRVAELAATLFYLATPLLVIKLGDELRDGSVDPAASQPLGALFEAQRSVAIVMIYLASSVLGLILAFLLYRSRLVPRPIAILGLIGYPVLLVGSALAAFDVTDVTQGAGLVALVPGGLFEVILPIWLIAKGFTFPRSAVSPAP